MATRKSKSLTFELVGSTPALAEAIAQIASTPGTHTIHLTLDGATMKAITDRMRRIPRQRGLNAVTIDSAKVENGKVTLSVTNTGRKAVPWPKPAKKAPAKSTARKSPAKSAKAPAKSTARKSPAKAPAKSARVVGKAGAALMESITGKPAGS